MGDKVLIEKHLGMEIYFTPRDGKFTADKPKLNLHFEGLTLYELKGIMNNSEHFIEEVDKELFKTEFREIQRIHVLTKHKSSKRFAYKIEDTTKLHRYDIGKIEKDEELDGTYPVTEKNTEVFNKVKELEAAIGGIEKQQEALMQKLEKKG